MDTRNLACAIALALPATAALANLSGPSTRGPLPDIRGRTFNDFFTVDTIGAVIGGQSIAFPLNVGTLTPVPHTFDVVADPAFPGDPSHIVIQTRLPSGSVGPGGIINPNGIPYYDLKGTYNQQTGQLDASGFVGGPQDWNIATNIFGLFPVPPDWTIWTRLIDTTLTLNGVVSIVGGEPFITGLNTTPVPPGPGNLTFASSLGEVFLLPPGVFSTALSPLPPIPVEDHFYGFSWTAAIPAPGTLGPLMLAMVPALRRRR